MTNTPDNDRHERALQRDQWQPIETAPKDGTIIHVFAPGYEWPEAVFYEAYGETDAAEVGAPGYWRYAETLLAEACDSAGEEDWTHWRHLPPAPHPHHFNQEGK